MTDTVVEQGLSDRDLAILELERSWWKYQGAKESAIREKFDMSPARYFQVLNTLIDDPAALEVDPTLVRRLQRLRTERRRSRSARPSGRVDTSTHGPIGIG